jgi:hypothetical protein
VDGVGLRSEGPLLLAQDKKAALIEYLKSISQERSAVHGVHVC